MQVPSGGVVVAAEHGDSFTPAGGGLQHQRDEMSLGIMTLTQTPLGVGTGGIEIAQADGFQAIGLVVVAEDLFDHALGAAIGIDGMLGMLFIDGRVVRLAEDGAVEEKMKLRTLWRRMASSSTSVVVTLL